MTHYEFNYRGYRIKSMDSGWLVIEPDGTRLYPFLPGDITRDEIKRMIDLRGSGSPHRR
ncbi:MAG: hypothetical protein AB9869_33185 [Verrucomicrobiia bacterium]